MDPDVRIEVPAEAEFVHVIRAVMAGVLARAGASVDELADLRLAVDEAASELLRFGGTGEDRAGRQLVVGIDRLDDGVAIEIAIAGGPVPGWPPVTTSLGWRILEGLVDEVQPLVDENRAALRLTRHVGIAR